MLPRSQENPWMRRTKWLTQALIISGTLNIGLIATFVYFVLKEKQEALAIELVPLSRKETLPTNEQLLRAYSLLPYHELLLRLENKDLIEEGLTKRDLALGCLVAFHYFNLDKALGGLPLQKRVVSLNEAQGARDIPLFPGLIDTQFQAIAHYAKTEKWPLTSQGLFYELKRSPHDLSLLDAFSLSAEYHAVQTLFSKTGLDLTREQLVDLLCASSWQSLFDFTQQQRVSMDLTPDRRRTFLLDTLKQGSKLAAELLVDTDADFALKRLDDAHIFALLDLYSGPALQSFCKELLSSLRTDAVCRRAAAHLYASVGEPVPEPYDHAHALQRFLPHQHAPEHPAAISSIAVPVPVTQPKKRLHTIEPGDNLWRIARKYHVSVEELMRANHMETERLRPGKQLEIPEKAPKSSKYQ